MLSLNVLGTFIRRRCILKANGCRQQDRLFCGACRMMKTSDECVFEQAENACNSSMGNNNKAKNVAQYRKHIDINNIIFNGDNHLQEQNYYAEYEEAVKALNNLQSNAECLRNPSHQSLRLDSLQDTLRYILKSGLTISDLEKLSYIHVSGTKGKGSTCALTESILRSYGVKTGFFSSPHLVFLTERLRINGQPISKQKFSQYFWPVYNKLNSSQEYENDMPAYFKFLTVLSFHIFLAEKVDVAIMEVGIGGELDCTNVVTNTKTVGICSLGLEHTQLLGNTLQEIAWQKAGIIKPYSTVYTSVTQEECLKVIEQRAKENQAVVHRVPEFETYFRDPKVEQIKKQLNACAVLNGSMAVQLAYDWLRQNCNGFHRSYDINKPHLTEQAIRGILNCNWPGRCQKIKYFNFNVHLDGAHTVESMQVCGNWFSQTTINSLLPKILIFNATGDRDTKKLLRTLKEFCKFDLVCFVPNIASLASLRRNQDTKSLLYTQVEQLKQAQLHSNNWQELCHESNDTITAKVFPSIVQCLQHIHQLYDKYQDLNILITGSIHLIGAAVLSLNELNTELNEQYV